jgi:hypothetical protein
MTGIGPEQLWTWRNKSRIAVTQLSSGDAAAELLDGLGHAQRRSNRGGIFPKEVREPRLFRQLRSSRSCS